MHFHRRSELSNARSVVVCRCWCSRQDHRSNKSTHFWSLDGEGCDTSTYPERVLITLAGRGTTPAVAVAAPGAPRPLGGWGEARLCVPQPGHIHECICAFMCASARPQTFRQHHETIHVLQGGAANAGRWGVRYPNRR